jgi:hypothetical protein
LFFGIAAVPVSAIVVVFIGRWWVDRQAGPYSGSPPAATLRSTEKTSDRAGPTKQGALEGKE